MAPSQQETRSPVSDAAVAEATGRDWAGWLAVLDRAGAAAWDHRRIVAHLEREHPEVPSGWWRQTIAVGYERARGLRRVGQTADAGFQVGVQRTVDAPIHRVWELLTARPDLWLGPGAEVAVEEGRAYAVPAGAGGPGACGTIRVVRPGSHVRTTWQPDGWERPARLQVRLTDRGPDRTTVGVHLELLPGPEARETMRDHWRAVLDRIEAALAT